MIVQHVQMLDKLYGPRLLTYNQQGEAVRSRKGGGDIPYGYPEFFKGTQAPVFRLRIISSDITPTTATLYSTVQGVAAAGLINFTDLAGMWDEYRVLRGEIEYITQSGLNYTTGALTPSLSGFAVIDYANSAALGSRDAALAHDTRVSMSLCALPGDVAPRTYRWPLHFEPLPDQQWTSTATTSTNFAYWKPFFTAQQVVIASGTVAGIWTGWVDVQVRGQAI